SAGWTGAPEPAAGGRSAWSDRRPTASDAGAPAVRKRDAAVGGGARVGRSAARRLAQGAVRLRLWPAAKGFVRRSGAGVPRVPGAQSRGQARRQRALLAGRNLLRA